MYEHKFNGIAVAITENFDFQIHSHYNIEICVCISGTVGVCCNGQSKILSAGEMMIAHSNDSHSYFSHGNGQSVLIIISPELLLPSLFNFSKYKYNNFCLDKNPMITELALMLHSEHNTDKNENTELAYASLILALALKTLGKVPTESNITDISFTGIVKFLSENYTSNITLRFLADKFNMDYYNLSKMFSKRLSCSFKHYVHILRIEHAKLLLQSFEKSISEIAYECGFSDIRTFNRVFKEISGYTPKDYRKTIK